jgi:hypothetical protein
MIYWKIQWNRCHAGNTVLGQKSIRRNVLDADTRLALLNRIYERKTRFMPYGEDPLFDFDTHTLQQRPYTSFDHKLIRWQNHCCDLPAPLIRLIGVKLSHGAGNAPAACLRMPLKCCDFANRPDAGRYGRKAVARR